jgi:hypothetical protein
MAMRFHEIDGDHVDALRYFLHRAGVSRRGQTLTAYCVVESAEERAALCRWVLEHADICFAEAVAAKGPGRLCLSAGFADWLLRECEAHGLEAGGTPFGQRHRTNAARASVFDDWYRAARAYLLELAYEREGRRGCCVCSVEDSVAEPLHFDHERTDSKSDCVTTLLARGPSALPEALAEGALCRIRCLMHHRERTALQRLAGEIRTPPRKPVSDDPAVERERARARAQSRVNRARHRARVLREKLLVGRCEECGRACTASNADTFEFGHRNLLEKRYNVSRMNNASEETFMDERRKCRVLCSGRCHNNETAAERQSGAMRVKVRLSAVATSNKRRRVAEAANAAS